VALGKSALLLKRATQILMGILFAGHCCIQVMLPAAGNCEDPGQRAELIPTCSHPTLRLLFTWANRLLLLFKPDFIYLLI
jgi:hypothetical protein